jgi:hypothetical protein
MDDQFSNRPTFDPAAQPKTPGFFQGLGFDETGYPKALNLLETGVLSGIAKGQAVLGGALHQSEDIDYTVDEAGGLTAALTGKVPDNTIADRISADARAKIKQWTPNAQTTGAAGQVLHGVASGATEMLAGGVVGGPLGAGAAVGMGEGKARYDDLLEAGVDPATARSAAGLTGVASAVGALLPGGIGKTLASKVATGTVGQTAMGMASRYGDHKILDDAGYTTMAAQQKVIDGTQMLADAVLGAAFGGIAHLHRIPGARDAALTVNLANKDRQSAPGIPTDPAAANAHDEALNTAIQDLTDGRTVDVSHAKVEDQSFIEREPPAADPIKEVIHDTGLLGEDTRAVNDALSGRATKVPRETPPESYVAPEEGTEEPAQASEPPRAEEEPGDRALRTGAENVVAENPHLMITDEEGNPIKASDALERMSEEATETKRESRLAVDAAVACFARRGN